MAATHSYGLLPTVVGIHVILIISLTIAPVCKGDETFCENICKKTSSPQLCTDILLKAPHSFSTIVQIQKHLLRVGEDNEDRMIEQYQLLRKKAADHDPVVSECEKLHVDSSFAYVDAYVDYKYKRYDGVKKNLSKVIENGALCTLASKFAIKNKIAAKIATLNRELINMDGHE